jgi:hypothetical protein
VQKGYLLDGERDSMGRRLMLWVSDLEGVDNRSYLARTNGFIGEAKIRRDEKQRWLKRI